MLIVGLKNFKDAPQFKTACHCNKFGAFSDCPSMFPLCFHCLTAIINVHHYSNKKSDKMQILFIPLEGTKLLKIIIGLVHRLKKGSEASTLNVFYHLLKQSTFIIFHLFLFYFLFPLTLSCFVGTVKSIAHWCKKNKILNAKRLLMFQHSLLI